jgi:hypothetical protein
MNAFQEKLKRGLDLQPQEVESPSKEEIFPKPSPTLASTIASAPKEIVIPPLKIPIIPKLQTQAVNKQEKPKKPAIKPSNQKPKKASPLHRGEVTELMATVSQLLSTVSQMNQKIQSLEKQLKDKPKQQDSKDIEKKVADTVKKELPGILHDAIKREIAVEIV